MKIVYAAHGALLPGAEDPNLLNYCFDHNFNDTKIKKPLPRAKKHYLLKMRNGARAQATIWVGEPPQAQGPRQENIFPLNLLTIFVSYKLFMRVCVDGVPWPLR